MKSKLFFIVILMAATLVSCIKENKSENNVSSNYNLPEKAIVYIENNYPDATIEYVVAQTNTSAAYLVTLITTEELAFDNAGTYIGEGFGYHQDAQNSNTVYNGHHGGNPGNGIPVDSLSDDINSFITSNFPDYQILHAATDSICPEGAVTVVYVAKPGTDPQRLVFGQDDIFLMAGSRISYADVPQAVQDTITAKYPGFYVLDKSEELSMADNSLQYMIYLRAENVRKKVRLDEEGALVCEYANENVPGGHHGGNHHADHHHMIPLDSLSTGILNYISANYPGYDVVHAEHGTICPDGKIVMVIVRIEGGQPVILSFGTNGTFLMSAARLLYVDVPQPVKDYITQHYREYFVVPMSEQLETSYNSTQYLIFLRSHHTTKKVRLSENGTLICEL